MINYHNVEYAVIQASIIYIELKLYINYIIKQVVITVNKYECCERKIL